MDLPLSQGFEAGEFPSNQWFIEDPLNDGTWELTDDAAATGSRCMFIENWGNNVEFNDDFLRYRHYGHERHDRDPRELQVGLCAQGHRRKPLRRTTGCASV